MFPYSTVLRFYPEEKSDDHYTAIILNNKGAVKEVKCPEPDLDRIIVYPSVDAWLLSLPYEDMSVDDLFINMKRPIYTKKTCNVPPLTNRLTTLNWGRHIYNVIHTYVPYLLKQDDVVDAYNALIECLSKYAYMINISIHKDDLYYIRQIQIKCNTLPAHCRFYVYNPSMIEKSMKDMYHSYILLYKLIDLDLLPFIQTKTKEYMTVVKLPIYKKNIIWNINRKMKRNENYKKMLEQRSIKLEKRIATLRSNYQRRIELYQNECEERVMANQLFLEELAPKLPASRRTRLQDNHQKCILKLQASYVSRTSKCELALARQVLRIHVNEERILSSLCSKYDRCMDLYDKSIDYLHEQIKLYSSA